MTEIENLKARIEELEKKLAKDQTTLLVMSDSFDRLFATLTIANGSKAMGMDVTLFFTFWGICTLRKPQTSVTKDFISTMFGWMLPEGIEAVKLSKLSMFGMGDKIIAHLMKKYKVPKLIEQLKLADELGVKIIVCELSMELMGIQKDELIDYKNISYGGVATFLNNASQSKVSLFI